MKTTKHINTLIESLEKVTGRKVALTELRDSRGNYQFDFEEWDNTDIAGMNAEVEIDNLIGDWKELIKKEVEKEAVGTGVDIEDVKRKAAREISRLWIEKIKRDLKF